MSSNNDERLNAALEKIDFKLDKLDDRLNSVEIILARNTESLVHHELRTTLNEENLELLRSDVKPLKAHVVLMNTGAKVISFLAALVLFLHEMGFLKNL